MKERLGPNMRAVLALPVALGGGALILLLLILSVLVVSTAARAQVGAPTNCSGTVGASAATVTLGHPPAYYLTISNPSASATIWVRPSGTAAANDSGSYGLTATGAGLTWALPSYPPPLSFSIVASAGSTPYTCWFQ